MREVYLNVKGLVQDYKHAKECCKEREYKNSASKYIYEGQMLAYARILSQLDPLVVKHFMEKCS